MALFEGCPYASSQRVHPVLGPQRIDWFMVCVSRRNHAKQSSAVMDVVRSSCVIHRVCPSATLDGKKNSELAECRLFDHAETSTVASYSKDCSRLSVTVSCAHQSITKRNVTLTKYGDATHHNRQESPSSDTREILYEWEPRYQAPETAVLKSDAARNSRNLGLSLTAS